MAEETATIEEEEETAAGPEEERDRSGPGLLAGLVLGALAGAAAATLFAPTTGDEIRHRISEEAGPLLKHQEGETGAEETESATPVQRMRAMLARVRSRVQEASEEAREAAGEAEAQGRARYAELTHQEQQGGA